MALGLAASSVGNMLETASIYSGFNVSGQNIRYRLSLLNATQPSATQALSISSDDVIEIPSGAYWTNSNISGMELSFPDYEQSKLDH